MHIAHSIIALTVQSACAVLTVLWHTVIYTDYL